MATFSPLQETSWKTRGKNKKFWFSMLIFFLIYSHITMSTVTREVVSNLNLKKRVNSEFQQRKILFAGL